MATTIPIIKITDPRTKLTYLLQYEGNREEAEKRIRNKMDYDYIESLSAEQRAQIKSKSTDFTCPICHAKKRTSIRKEQIKGGLFSSGYLIDINICPNCKSEFLGKELNYEKERIQEINRMILSAERAKKTVDN